MRVILKSTIVAGVFGLCVSHSTIAEHEQIEHAASEAHLVVGGAGSNCLTDSDCINRFHPDIPMKHIAQQGQTLIFKTRDALDVLGTVDQQRDAGQDLDSERFMTLRSSFGTAHPMAGPVHIAGADVGDTLKVTILEINAGQYGYTFAGRSGFMSDLVDGGFVAVWKLTDRFATSADIPGIRIPNGSFPGIVATLPGKRDLEAILIREQKLHDAGGKVFLPYPEDASPVALCGKDGSAANACLRTIPPREQGGNMDIRHLGEGVTVYLPCQVAGCGLVIGDLHYAQGDGEVSGTAIEMSADVTVTTEVIKGYSDLRTGPHYEGDASVLQIPSTRFYAVTGLPLKTPGASYPNLHYLGSDVARDLSNLSNDISLAARNALDGMIDHIVTNYGYSRNQAYVIASVAVDLRITQLVDAPNVGVTAILPLDIFIQVPH
jgi:formamidase